MYFLVSRNNKIYIFLNISQQQKYVSFVVFRFIGAEGVSYRPKPTQSDSAKSILSVDSNQKKFGQDLSSTSSASVNGLNLNVHTGSEYGFSASSFDGKSKRISPPASPTFSLSCSQVAFGGVVFAKDSAVFRECYDDTGGNNINNGSRSKAYYSSPTNLSVAKHSGWCS